MGLERSGGSTSAAANVYPCGGSGSSALFTKRSISGKEVSKTHNRAKTMIFQIKSSVGGSGLN
jgi:hypothetical protein